MEWPGLVWSVTSAKIWYSDDPMIWNSPARECQIISISEIDFHVGTEKGNDVRGNSCRTKTMYNISIFSIPTKFTSSRYGEKVNAFPW
ncbi:unnamed protein product [Fusarium graminearum]|uniref:Chromosome 3, complete genome n=1 Tax=Gibberella zeae (strain ATCC MYA-4620 / CBS 123657 / FGSC 9075 / NRRL 31084 / PH-1) TaxID=229533 RepID=A0A0E0SHT5_GIBZE|nr:hypothetical protein FG05_30125 [Fusarium graminearum]CEF85998.1 unnamed protein product [Fusarium graminearum]CZS83682.1 unnamed protein product [Fusarium graminearum]